MSNLITIENLSTCFSCGKNARKTYQLKLALSPEFRPCAECLLRHGEEALAEEANRMFRIMANGMLGGKLKANTKCMRCESSIASVVGKPSPAWCDDCERERRQLASS